MAGVDLRTIQELGGWASLDMVQRYAYLSLTLKAEAVERIAAHFPTLFQTPGRARILRARKPGEIQGVPVAQLDRAAVSSWADDGTENQAVTVPSLSHTPLARRSTAASVASLGVSPQRFRRGHSTNQSKNPTALSVMPLPDSIPGDETAARL